MAKIETKVTLESLKTTQDDINWIDGEEYEFIISIEKQENGLGSVVSLPNVKGFTNFSFSEIKELYKAMAHANDIIGE